MFFCAAPAIMAAPRRAVQGSIHATGVCRISAEAIRARIVVTAVDRQIEVSRIAAPQGIPAILRYTVDVRLLRSDRRPDKAQATAAQNESCA
jgi:hypothetical protein